MSLTDNKMIHKSEHQEVWELLPWYINHSLDTTEEHRVRTHAKNCIACKIELTQQQQIFEKVNQVNLLQQTAQISFAQLKQRIEKQPKVSVISEHDKQRKMIQRFEFFCSNFFSFNYLKYAAVVAGIIMLTVPFIFSPFEMHESTNVYRTLATSPEGIGRENNLARVVFSEHATSQQIKDILISISGHIINGPSRNGVYEVAIGNHQASMQEINESITRLQNHNLVIFAGLTQGSASD